MNTTNNAINVIPENQFDPTYGDYSEVLKAAQAQAEKANSEPVSLDTNVISDDPMTIEEARDKFCYNLIVKASLFEIKSILDYIVVVLLLAGLDDCYDEVSYVVESAPIEPYVKVFEDNDSLRSICIEYAITHLMKKAFHEIPSKFAEQFIGLIVNHLWRYEDMNPDEFSKEITSDELYKAIEKFL